MIETLMNKWARLVSTNHIPQMLLYILWKIIIDKIIVRLKLKQTMSVHLKHFVNPSPELSWVSEKYWRMFLKLINIEEHIE